MRALSSPAQSAQATTLTRRPTTTPRGSSLHLYLCLPAHTRTNSSSRLRPIPAATAPPPPPPPSLSTPASHGALVSPDPRDALSTPDSRRPDVQMLRSAAADSERPLAAEVYALAESQYGSISRAPARAPDVLRPPPKKEIIGTHLTACESEKGRTGISNTSVLAPCPVRWHAREERLPDPLRVARVQSLRTLRIFDSLHASPARGVAMACMLVLSRVARAAVCTRARRVAPSPLARIGLALLVGNARAVSIIFFDRFVRF
ncbi:hypothetical protein C8J57DRAFT_1482790 [Mycena rebaudengoi]|nr:hypothetical protein C8J57DRAFT_1482790 [Mycena rebaudengoi]